MPFINKTITPNAGNAYSHLQIPKNSRIYSISFRIATTNKTFLIFVNPGNFGQYEGTIFITGFIGLPATYVGQFMFFKTESFAHGILIPDGKIQVSGWTDAAGLAMLTTIYYEVDK